MGGLNKELDTMETKNVLEKVRQSEFPNAKPVPSKLVLTKKPMEDSEVIIKSDMGASEIAALIQQAWNPRVRLVACGNFEKDSKAHDPENFAGNPGAETVRILLSILARRPTNMTAVVLDISCAFLNARLDRSPDAKPVFIQPPSIIYKLGLLEKGFIWRARKAIYGLRRSPRQWELERNGELDGVTLEPLPHHEHGLLSLETLESGTWLIRDSSGEVQGAMVMYVDDALIIGDLEICARLKAKLSRSAFEAEVDAAAITCQSGAQIKHLLSAITGDQKMCLFSDNAACVINLVREDGALITTRTRTVGIRCSYVRDQAVLEGFDIQHMSRNELPADALTKTLKRSALELARARP